MSDPAPADALPPTVEPPAVVAVVVEPTLTPTPPTTTSSSLPQVATVSTPPLASTPAPAQSEDWKQRAADLEAQMQALQKREAERLAEVASSNAARLAALPVALQALVPAFLTPDQAAKQIAAAEAVVGNGAVMEVHAGGGRTLAPVDAVSAAREMMRAAYDRKKR